MAKKRTAKKRTAKKRTAKKPTAKKQTPKKRTAKKSTSSTRSAKSPDAHESPNQGSRAVSNYLRAVSRSPGVAYRRAERVLNNRRDEIHDLPGVLGCEVGMKILGRHSTREFAIVVYVERKAPTKSPIPDYYDGVPTDVQERHFVASASIPGGEKIRPQQRNSRYGTMGFDVVGSAESDWGGLVRFLTAAHVVDPDGIVNAPTTMLDDSQKSIGVAGKREDIDWAFGMELDCAIITPPSDLIQRVGILGGEKDPVGVRAVDPEDMYREHAVWKFGASTLKTTNGIVTTVQTGLIPVEYKLPGGGAIVVLTQNQIKLRAKSPPPSPFARAGDSGSIVCIDDMAVGVIRAVDETAGEVLACPLVDAAAALNFNI